MAADFIILRTTLPTSREVLILADMCGCEADLILGRLARFWIWADAETKDGDLPGLTIEMLSKALGIPVNFFNALQTVAWLEVHDWGLRIPNWERWFSESAKARCGEVIRKRMQRSAEKDGEGAVRTMSGQGCRKNQRGLSGQCPDRGNAKTKGGCPDNVRTKEERIQNTEESINILSPNGDSALAPPEAALSAEPTPQHSGNGYASSLRLREAIEKITQAWNSTPGVTPIRKWSDSRKKHLRARLADPTWLDDALKAIATIPKCPFLLGDNDRGWRADIEWFLRPDSVAKVLEGKYARAKPPLGKKDLSWVDEALSELSEKEAAS